MEVNMKYILFNPLSGYGRSEAESKLLAEKYGDKCELMDITKIDDYNALIEPLCEDDEIVIFGGDGTLNKFINNTDGIDIKCKILYHASGTGNDFLTDVAGKACTSLIDIKKYFADLPSVCVNGNTYRFLNNVGFGIDGYCCEVGDAQKQKSEKKVNYTAIAIKGLLFHYKPTGATVTVDGVKYRYENVWLAPTMHGRYYGGGMLPCPEQDRNDPEGKLSVMLMHGSGKLKTLMVFPKIFEGGHIAHENMVAVHSGRSITVKFDSPRALQIDGETILGVTEYTAVSGVNSEKGTAPKEAEQTV